MTTTKAGCTPPTSTAAAAEQLMTQAKRPGPHKRKSALEAVHLQDSDVEAHESKRARLAEELEQAAAEQATAEQAAAQQQQQQEQAQAQNGRQQSEPASSSQGEAAGTQNGKGKSMLGVVFSPLFNVFNRNNSMVGTTAPTASAATELQPEPAPVQAASEEEAEAASPRQPLVSSTATDAIATAAAHTHHAHHPPPPEVPEAAESESVDDDDGMELEFDPLLFIRSLPPLEQCVPRHRTALLPRKTRQCKQKTLVLDLDETLVHSSVEAQIPGAPPPDFTLNVSVNHIHHTIHVRRRPHLAEFMQAVAGLFEIVVFTASQKPYAEQLLNILDPKRCLVKHRVFRDSCVIVDGNYLKDLTILGRDMATTCIVDNSPHAFGFQPDNGIPIESWFDDAGDSELLKLLPFLRQLAADEVQDVRPLIAKKFRLKELIAKLPTVA